LCPFVVWEAENGESGGFAVVVGYGGNLQNGSAERDDARDNQFPRFQEHVHADEEDGDGDKGQREDCEGSDQFTDEIELREAEDGEETPEPVAPAVARGGGGRRNARGFYSGGAGARGCGYGSRFGEGCCCCGDCCAGHDGLLIFLLAAPGG